jgi:hypothetical protein
MRSMVAWGFFGDLGVLALQISGVFQSPPGYQTPSTPHVFGIFFPKCLY